MQIDKNKYDNVLYNGFETTILDDISFYLYIEERKILQPSFNSIVYEQSYFMFAYHNKKEYEEYYKEGNIYLRGEKIRKLKDGIR